MTLIHKISLLAVALVATATGSAVIGYVNRTIEIEKSKQEEIKKEEVKLVTQPKKIPKDCTNKVGWFWTRGVK